MRSSQRLRREWTYGAVRDTAASEDDDAAAAQPARLHRPVRVGGLLGRVLGGDAQRQAAVAARSRRRSSHSVRSRTVRTATGRISMPRSAGRVVPPADDRHRAAVADRAERGAAEEGGVDEAVDAVGHGGADGVGEAVAPRDDLGAEARTSASSAGPASARTRTPRSRASGMTYEASSPAPPVTASGRAVPEIEQVEGRASP